LDLLLGLMIWQLKPSLYRTQCTHNTMDVFFLTAWQLFWLPALLIISSRLRL